MPNRVDRRSNKDNPASKIAKQNSLLEQINARRIAREKRDARIKELEKIKPEDRTRLQEKELRRIKP